MKVLVTGAGGFIGGHLVDCLIRDGHAVRAMVHRTRPASTWTPAIEVVTGDVCDAAMMKEIAVGCEAVFHLAGKAHALAEIRPDEETYRAINAKGTRVVLDAAVSCGAKRFVLFSSVKAMGEGGGRCMDESFDGQPEAPYGRSKLEAERITLDVGKRSGLHVTCLRLPLVYGPGNKGNLYKMIVAVDRGFFPSLPEVLNQRSLVHVKDVVQAAMLVMSRPEANGQLYIVTDGQVYSSRQLYESICRALGKPVPPWHLPLWGLMGAARAGDLIGRVLGRRALFDSDVLEKLIGSACYCSEKITRQVGYRATLTFDMALPELIAWYRGMLA